MESEQEQKLRGGFYTPPEIANFLAKWAILQGNESVLEPGCGDGNIIEAVLSRGASLEEGPISLTGIEMDESEAQKASERANELAGNQDEVEIVNQDFFQYCIEQSRWRKTRFDVVLGNPPFIRYQDFPEDQRERALEILQEGGLSPTRQMNAWMPFLIGSTQLLKEDGGRLAMVIPATLLQVNYAGELREFLIEQFSHITVITFTELVFDGLLEEVVLLLGERNGTDSAGLNLVELDSAADLYSYDHETFEKEDVKDVNHSTEKWTLYFLDQTHIDLVRELPSRDGIQTVDDYADVNVGVVTGRNEFFIHSAKEARDLGIEEFTRPIVSRSAHLGEGIRFTSSEYDSNIESDLTTHLLDLPEQDRDTLPKPVRTYIRSGERRDFHNGYKCSLRDYWFTVPSIWVPDGFLLRQIHEYPKFVYNETDATCTDTIHRVRYNGPQDSVKEFFAATHNSLTWAFSEFIGRSYGGGILELEPNEAEELPIPTENWENICLEEVDTILRNEGSKSVIDYTDEILLLEGLGLTEAEVEMLRDIWQTLQQRRLNRS